MIDDQDHDRADDATNRLHRLNPVTPVPPNSLKMMPPLVLCQSCSDVFRADLLPRGMAVGGGGGEAVPGEVDGGGA